ncbi:cytochrome P450 family protein [Frankia sp. Cas3]|uniref:cytochrome P450 family protein n=1 Tax=Frankia sp. Cas3 TaxID=3073926 RepID=UPI003A102CAC
MSDPEVLRDPFTAYGRARELSPVARLAAPGFGGMWVLTRHDGARAMLNDPRFELNAGTYMRPAVPEHCQPYMQTMQEMEGPAHSRLRRLVSPAFSARRAAEFRPRIVPIVSRLLDDVAAQDGPVDMLERFARPLPMDVICELVGIAEADRPQWRDWGAAVAAGHGETLVAAIPGIIDGARAAVGGVSPGDDLINTLRRVHADDDDQLSETELVTLVWHLVLAGQTPTNLVANAVEALLSHPSQLAALRANPALMPCAVEELTRWCGPQMLTFPRFAREDVTIEGVAVGKGEPITASIVSVNRDPRVFADPERLDITRSDDPSRHLGYAYGPHFCLGASLARVQVEVALSALLDRFPDLALADTPGRIPDPGTWRLTSLRVTL